MVQRSYNGRLTASCIWSTEWCHFQVPWTTPTQISRARHYSTLNDSETIQDRHGTTDQKKILICGLFNFAIINDLKW